MSNAFRRLAPLLACALVACSDSTGRIINVDATGTVFGTAVVDADGDHQVSAGDHLFTGLRLIVLDGRDTLASGLTDKAGPVAIGDVPVGRYSVVVDTSSVPDSLHFEAVDSPYVTVAANDSVGVIARISYPRLAVADARAAPSGTRVFVEGVALNNWATFADSTLHIRDSSGTMRALRVAPASISAGDSIRVLGAVGSRAGEPVLQGATAFFLQAVQPPEADTITTAQAANAAGGTLDAALVAVANAVVGNSAFTSTGDLAITVDDGSGPVDVLLDRNIQFYLPAGSLVGRHIDATGLLVPRAPGDWVLKPRASTEFIVAP